MKIEVVDAMARRSKPISARDLDAVRQPLERASNLPGSLYVSPEVFALERREIFQKMWLCVARVEDLAEPGDYLALDVVGEPILVTRARDGRLRAFYNVCRHRGSLLVDDGSGNAGRCIRCPYHAWSYELDGRLAGAPMMDRVPDFRREDHSLARVRLDTWRGFVFVSLADDGDSLDGFLADFPDVSRYRLDELGRGHRIGYDVEANWKVLCENYGECYHCAVAHPQLNRISDFTSGGKSMVGDCFCGGPMELNEGYTTLSTDGHSDLPAIPGLSDEDHRTIHYYNLYPNLFLSLHPDYVLVHTLWPEGPGRTRIVCDFLFAREALERSDVDPGDVIDFWDLTNRQDWELCERVQKGVGSRGHRAGRYQPLETSVHNFDRWIVGRLEPFLDAEPPGAGKPGAPERDAPERDAPERDAPEGDDPEGEERESRRPVSAPTSPTGSAGP